LAFHYDMREEELRAQRIDDATARGAAQREVGDIDDARACHSGDRWGMEASSSTSNARALKKVLWKRRLSRHILLDTLTAQTSCVRRHH
jgi:hypothetical protein